MLGSPEGCCYWKTPCYHGRLIVYLIMLKGFRGPGSSKPWGASVSVRVTWQMSSTSVSPELANTSNMLVDWGDTLEEEVDLRAEPDTTVNPASSVLGMRKGHSQQNLVAPDSGEPLPNRFECPNLIVQLGSSKKEVRLKTCLSFFCFSWDIWDQYGRCFCKSNRD